MASSINASITSTGIIQTADATGILQLQTDGTTGLTLNANANITVSNSLFVSGSSVQPIVLDTAQNTTSGTSIDFTSIPSWVKRVTVILRGVSTNGTSIPIVRLGTSGGFVATGYLSTVTSYGGGGTGTGTQFTTGFGTAGSVSASTITTGLMTLVNISGTTWVGSYTCAFNDAAYSGSGGGYVDAGGTLTSVRLTTVNGTDTFDAGSVNILYE